MNIKILIFGTVALLASCLPVLAQAPANDGLLTELQSIELEQQRLGTRRAKILEDLKQREEALTAELFALRHQIGMAKQQEDAASIVRLTAISAPAEKANNDVPATEPQDREQDAPEDAGGGEPPTPPNGSGKADDDPKGWFLGAGLGTRFNLSGKRVEEVSLADLADGSLLAQVTKSDQSEIRILFESHYMFDNPSIQEVGLFSKLEAFASCGIWSFITTSKPPEHRACGPFVAVAFDTDASPQEFAIGHMVSFFQSRLRCNHRPGL